MSSIVPLSLAKKLFPYGLHKTLIGVPANTDLSINRLAMVDGKPTLSRVGAVRMFPLLAIGRLALPDPVLDIPWTNSLTFYGRRFDNYRTNDPTGTVQKKIVAASKAMTLMQIRRDDDYAITGSFYSVFKDIMEAKEQVPLFAPNHHLREQVMPARRGRRHATRAEEPPANPHASMSLKPNA